MWMCSYVLLYMDVLYVHNLCSTQTSITCTNNFNTEGLHTLKTQTDKEICVVGYSCIVFISHCSS